jgi:Putative Flp pilus-assembly TadE/G-like
MLLTKIALARSRGQTLPIWALGIAAALVLAFAALQYGEVLRWQVRAQNAADAAATAALSVQTQTWNQQLALVYAAAVEEWRIRNLLNGMQAAAYGDPGCGSNCAATFAALRDQYMKAVNRYTNDVQLVNRTSQYTFSQAQADATAMVAQLQANCGQANGGDCGFTYNVVAVVPRQGMINDVEQDGGAWVINNPGTPAAVKQDYTPAQIEIVTCAKVAPIVPSFLGFEPPTFTAVGRAAATSAMVTQEWTQPGFLNDPRTGAPFQPVESYGPATNATGPSNWNWFTIQFGGNPATAFPKYDAYAERVNGPEFSAVTGWWNAVPIKPFSGKLDTAQLSCKAS